MVVDANNYLSASLCKLYCVAHEIYDHLFQATLISNESGHELLVPRSAELLNICVSNSHRQFYLPGICLRGKNLINILQKRDRTKNCVLELYATKFYLLQVQEVSNKSFQKLRLTEHYLAVLLRLENLLLVEQL